MLWSDGRLCEGSTVPFDLSDRGLLLGDGVFDTALAIDGRILFEDAHVARLLASTEALGFTVAERRVREAMRAVSRSPGHVALRTTVTRGSGPRGLAPPTQPGPAVFASGAAARRELQYAPIRLTWSPIRRNETSPTSRLKTLNYLDAVMAARDAAAAGFDDALFLNMQGRVACIGIGNIFVVADGSIVTPSLAEGILNGIIRQEALQAARGLGINVVERPIRQDEVAAASAVFATNSLRLLSPVTAIGTLALPSQTDGIVQALTEALRARVAEEALPKAGA